MGRDRPSPKHDIVVVTEGTAKQDRDLELQVWKIIWSRASEAETARAATRHGARDPLVRPQVDQTYIDNLDNHLDKNF